MTRELTRAQKVVLGAAFVIMAAVGGFGGYGTFSNIGHAYGTGTALGAVAAGEGATAVLGLVLLGLTMLGQSSPRMVRLGLWALPAAASVMAAMAGPDAGRTVIYAVTPMGMCVSAEGMAFLARRIVVHTDGRDAEAEARTAAVVRRLAYHRAVAANHPSKRHRTWSERRSWSLARKVGTGDHTLGLRLIDVQRERLTSGADAALAEMFTAPIEPPAPPTAAPIEPPAQPTDASIDTPDSNAEESIQCGAFQSGADVPESTPVTVTLTRVPVPDPVPVDAGKSTLPLKPARALAAPIESAPVTPIRSTRPVAAESTRPLRATYRVPESAKSPRPRRTREQLLTEAMELTEGWPQTDITAERLRREMRISPERARMLRDVLLGKNAPAEEASA
ncbi:conjugal transfer protein [Streptomyces lavenduligriseus]|uniref:Conjugal transfer protein n=1 Tax=Streptomyces lavenduligriseus TaxID=67315 RepID=A0ABT0P2N1_9ACTN|nr:conjugal transfer protein [Streptomyces lavenduligriseus]MCL3998013.1 conjugal transfer protein [Streptomyces lavenduligriseus]